MTTWLRRALPVLLTVVFLAVAVTVIVTAKGDGGPGGGGPGEGPTSALAGPTPTTTDTPPLPPPRCGSAQSGERAGTRDGALRIGTMLPLTGRELGSYGPALTAAAQLAVKDVQDATGSSGIPGVGNVTLGPETDEGDPGSFGPCSATATLLSARVDAVVGPFASLDTLDVYQRVTGSGTLMVSPANTLNRLSTVDARHLYFRTASTNDIQGAALAGLVAAEGKKNVAVVVSDETFASDLATETLRGLQGRVGYTVLPYSRQNPQFAELADKVTDPHYDGIVFLGFYEVAGLVKILIDRGFLPKDHAMYGGTGFMINDFAKTASTNRVGLMEGFRGFVPWADSAFNDKLKATRPPGQLTDLTYGAQTYDAVIVTALAATAAGSDDPTEIARQLPEVTRGGTRCGSYAECVTLLRGNPRNDIDYVGVSGPLGFNARGDLCQANYLLSAFDARGGLAALPNLGIMASRDQCG